MLLRLVFGIIVTWFTLQGVIALHTIHPSLATVVAIVIIALAVVNAERKATK